MSSRHKFYRSTSNIVGSLLSDQKGGINFSRPGAQFHLHLDPITFDIMYRDIACRPRYPAPYGRSINKLHELHLY